MSEPTHAEGPRNPWSGPVRDLLSRMTLEEKAAQISAVVLTDDERTPAAPGIGVVYVSVSHPDSAARLASFREATPAGRLGIPALPLAIGPDLGRPFLPPLGRVATWDLRLAEQMAGLAARAQRAAGLYGHLVPAGSTSDRGDEASGPPAVSDPLLSARFAVARIHGAQGRSAGRVNPIGPEHVAVLVPLGVWPDGEWHERTLRTHLLASAEVAVRSGAAAVVPTPTGNAGVPAHTDGWLLRDILRHEWRFGGAVLAHPGGVEALDTDHHIAGGPDQAVALALEAGVDVVGSGPGAVARLVALVRSGGIPSWLLDDAVAAVLTLKFRLGLLGNDDPATPVRVPAATAPPEESAARMARTALTGSLVLLTDPKGLLPLAGVRIVDVVPGAVDSPDVDALAGALTVALPASTVRVGSTTEPTDADVVVVVTVRPEDAVRTAENAVASGRFCIVVVAGDRVHTLDALAATTATVLVCWRPLGRYAHVLGEVLAGHVEPGGRLPLALPAGAGEDAVFPLGHGNGYTTFDYSRLTISPTVLDGGEVLRVRCRVTNTGRRAGREVVQVYLDNPTGRTVVTRGIALAAFSVVEVAAGQSLPVTIQVPLARLAVWNRSMHHILEPGTVDVLVGRSATDIRLRGTVTIAAHPTHRNV